MDDDDDDLKEGSSVYDNMVSKKKASTFCPRLFSQKSKRDGASSSKASAGGGAGQSAELKWSSHLTTTKASMKSGKGGQETLQKVAILAAANTTLKESALSCIADVGNVHTVDLESCKLREIPPYLDNVETLVILRLIGNTIRRVPKEVGQCKKLEILHLGGNHISFLDPEVFSDRAFPQLEVISLRHNKLSMLPKDFGLTATPCRIKHIDLAENNLAVLPDSIAFCQSLRFLDITKNRITQLPKSFQFPKLEKLFMSFNAIVELPEGIGDCTKLEKIRMTNNLVRRLPDNLLNLRKTLQEFQVEKNPLVIPSITAFEMGGLENLFKLLDEHVRNAKALSEAVTVPALMSTEQQALDNEAAGQQAALDMEVQALQEGATQRDNRSGLGSGLDYYFSHCVEGFPDKMTGAVDEQAITEIRRAESTLLIIKKNVYFQSQVSLAKDAEKNGGIENVPKNLKKFLDPTYDVTKWHGVSRVTDLDLYFNLLVYSTKPLYSSCWILFDKYETEDKGYLNKEEWNEFVSSSPVLLEDPAIHEGMWNLMSWRANDRVTLTDFVAAWHIHDVEDIDPVIQRSAQVLRLDYYDMSIQELQNRLRSKDAEDATPMLDFDQDSDDEPPEDSQIRIERVEGERFVLPASNVGDKGKPKDKTSADTNGRLKPVSENGIEISMTDAQYAEYENAHGGGDDDDGDKSDISVQSNELSESTDGDQEDFDFCVDDHWVKMGDASEGNGQLGEVQVRSDDAVKELMNMDPASFFKRMPKKNKSSAAEAKALLPRKDMPKGKKQKTKVTDSRYKTDVFLVRQEIRRVFRNLPYDDFVKLINFLLRGMQMIKHSRKATTYWHADDPTFKFTMGVSCSNLYTRRLLWDMGFVLVDNLYWVWPVVHMKEVSKLAKDNVPVWGDEEIPRSCPGRNEDRLDDMIALLRNCQKRLHKQQKAFNGNFP